MRSRRRAATSTMSAILGTVISHCRCRSIRVAVTNSPSGRSDQPRRRAAESWDVAAVVHAALRALPLSRRSRRAFDWSTWRAKRSGTSPGRPKGPGRDWRGPCARGPTRRCRGTPTAARHACSPSRMAMVPAADGQAACAKATLAGSSVRAARSIYPALNRRWSCSAMKPRSAWRRHSAIPHRRTVQFMCSKSRTSRSRSWCWRRSASLTRR